jgi:hypothetical protein
MCGPANLLWVGSFLFSHGMPVRSLYLMSCVKPDLYIKKRKKSFFSAMREANTYVNARSMLKRQACLYRNLSGLRQSLERKILGHP